PELEGTIFWSTYQEAMFTNQMREVEAYYKPMDILFSVRVYPSKDGITIFYRNITDRKKIEKETLNSVGQELHDNVMQIITAANMYLNVVRKQTENPTLDQVHNLISQAVSEIRMLSHDLISPFTSG